MGVLGAMMGFLGVLWGPGGTIGVLGAIMGVLRALWGHYRGPGCTVGSMWEC